MGHWAILTGAAAFSERPRERLTGKEQSMAEPNPMQSLAAAERFYGRLDPRRASLRLVVGLVAGVVSALLAHRHAWQFRLLLGWDAGAFALLLFIWFTVLTKDPLET